MASLASTTTTPPVATNGAPSAPLDAFGNQEMYVTKRNGKKETISFDKILKRIKKVGKEDWLGIPAPAIKINYTQLTMKIIDQLFNGIPTDKIDEISAEQCASMSSIHYDYGTLASRIAISNHHKNTGDSFSATMKKLGAEGILNKNFLQTVHTHAKHLDALCDYKRDYYIDYFGFKTLERSYLLSIKKRIYERPQMMFMRLAVAMHGNDLSRVEETYNVLSNKKYIHGTPSLYNAGTQREQMSSCFVKGTKVHTTTRGPVPIEDVQIGDYVTTHTGQVRRVDQVHANALGDRRLFAVSFYGKPVITVTEDHPLYIYNAETATVSWKPVGDLDATTDYVMIARYDPQEYPDLENDNDLNFESPYMIMHGGAHYIRFLSKLEVFPERDFKSKLKSTEGEQSEPFVDLEAGGEEVQTVYTLGVEQDHSYCVEGIIAQNCYLLAMEEDSIDGIFNTLKECALISKYAGGIGLHIHNVRATGTHIAGTNGSSNGIVPMLRVFNHTAKYVDQCLDPETVVFTERGPIPIKEVVIGDKVITDDGNMYPIGKVLDNEYEGVMYEVKVKRTMDSMHLTDMHPLWAIQKDEFTTLENVKGQLDRGLLKPDFVEVKHLKKGDYVGFPIPKYEHDIPQYTVDDCRMYGILVSSGEMSSNNMITNISGIKKHKSQTFIEDYLKKLSIPYRQNSMENYAFNRSSAFKFTVNMLYDGHKKILPSFLHLPTDKIKSFLLGMIETRSHIVNDQYGTPYAIKVETYGTNVVESLRYMLLRLGILCWCDKAENESYKIYIPLVSTITELFPNEDLTGGKEPRLSHFEYDGYLFSPIKTIEESTKKQRVIDIEVDHPDHHNFLTHAGLVKNGGGKRNGSFAIYLEPWHADIELYLQMRKNHGEEELKARDLFYALWVPDLFMKRIKENGKWSLFCPHECPGLADVYGEAFDALYEKYEREGKARSTINARDLWFKVLDAQMETGTPYLVYKDAANKKSNQQNLGTIKSSNLCVAPETLVLTDRGNVPIKELKDQTVRVWNGEEFSEVTVKQTSYGVGTELITIETSDGNSLDCTKYHKFYIKNMREGAAPGLTLTVEAKDLSIGDHIIDWELPIIDGEHEIEEPYLNGVSVVLLKDSTILQSDDDEEGANANYVLIIPKELEKIMEHIPYIRSRKTLYVRDGEDGKRIDVEKWAVEIERSKLQPNTVPNNHKMNTKMAWLSGFYDTSAQTDGSMKTLYKETGEAILMMLQTCGIRARMESQHDYRILLKKADFAHLLDLGFSPKVAAIPTEFDPKMERDRPVKISRIIHEYRRDETYCFTEPKRHAGVFNGILTGQCSEIIQYSDAKETSICNLASIALPAYVKCNEDGTVHFDFEELHRVSRLVTYNLNRVIDINYYPTEKARRSNMRHRPIGIGVQGLADTFFMMGCSFGDEASVLLNRQIFETIYHAALTESCEIAKRDGPYETFQGSPASKGQFQFDLWDKAPIPDRYDWEALRREVMQHGIRNSLLLAPMPTASTSQILGYNECIEPITSNIYSRRTLAGEFIIVNRYLMRELIDRGLWNERMKNQIIANNGSIQGMDIIPKEVQEKYKTVWEIPMRTLIDMAADRGIYVDQSQSLNLWLEDPNYNTLTSMHFYSWTKGLKTGIYYLRRRAKHQAQQFTIEPEKASTAGQVEDEEEEICEMCSG